MISVSGKKWEQKKINKNSIDKLKQDYDFSNILARLVISRNFDQFFFVPTSYLKQKSFFNKICSFYYFFKF